MNVLKSSTKAGKIIISLALLVGYWQINFLYGVIPAIIGLTIYLFFREKKKIESGNERFRDDNLFFRYGSELPFEVIPIPVKDEWGEQESTRFADGLIQRMMNDFVSVFGNNPLHGKQIVGIISVTDSDQPSDSRGFLKISFSGRRGAILTRFFTYEVLGKNVVLHRLVYLLGIANWWDKLFYFMTSPLTILFWIWRWIKGEYSIYAAVAKGIDHSFEKLDLRAFYASSEEILKDAIIAELKANDLYTPQLAMIINQTFNTFNMIGTQINQNISGSGNSVIGQIK